MSRTEYATMPPLRRRPHVSAGILAACVVAGGMLVASGCAGPLSQGALPSEQSIVAHAISEQRDGSCGGLEAARAQAEADRKAAEARIEGELKAPAATLAGVWQRAFGERGSGTKSYEVVQHAREKVVALDHELAARQCGERPAAAAPTVVAPSAAAPAATARPASRRAG